jgi:hypothetical protein
MATAICPIQVDTLPSKGLRRRKADRRSNQRFELALEFDLFLLRGAKRLVWCAAGTTVDWSRNSILLRCGRNLAEGSSVQLVVRWTAGVQLVVTGRVIRSDERGMVFRIQRRRFRGKPLLIVTLEQLISWQPTGRPN